MATLTENIETLKSTINAEKSIIEDYDGPVPEGTNISTYEEKVRNIIKGRRHIGEIFYSTVPITDAGVHILDGSLLLDGGIYDSFITYIASLKDSYPNLFCTEEEWQSSVSTYGVCGKYVLTEGTSLRLPKITGFIEGISSTTDLGNIKEAGIPIDASMSNPVFGKSDTVQPQAIQLLVYVQVANSIPSDVELDIDNITTEVANKAYKTEVANKADKTEVANKAFPSDKYTDLTFSNGAKFTAPADGYYCLGGSSQSLGQAGLQNLSYKYNVGCTVQSGSSYGFILPACKGNICRVYGDIAVEYFRFIYANSSK